MNAAADRSQIFAGDALAGVSVLITGGGTGLGKASALELARCGAAVTIAGRRVEVLEEAVAQATAEAAGREGVAAASDAGEAREGVAGGSVDWVQADVRDPASARALIAEVLERRGHLDVLVNNAGGQFFSPAELIATKGWRAVWRLNVEGMLNLSEAAHELAFGPGGGAIINVTLSPHHGMPGMAHSGAARATVEQLTRELAARWAPDVAVVAVAAGHFATEVTAKYPESVRAGASRTVPVQRLGEPIEHAWLVTLLASAAGRAFSGSTVTLDGGRDNWFGPWPPPGLAGEGGEVPVEERKGDGTVGEGPGLQ